MATASATASATATASDQIDRLSPLPDALLISILSFLPTRIAARTSRLSRRFRHLWSASPSLHLVSRHLPPPKSHNFAAMVHSALLTRHPSHPLHSLLLDVSTYTHPHSFLPSLLSKAASLGLRHLTIQCCTSSDLLASIPVIFSIPTLETLSIVPTLQTLSPAIALTRLQTLSLSLLDVHPLALPQFLSQLPSLQDLHLQLYTRDALTISSPSITKLNLIIVLDCQNSGTLELSTASLQSLSLETHGSFYPLPNIHAELPSLTKAVINLNDLRQRDVAAVAGLLNRVSHVQELCLEIKESEDEIFPFPILLEPGKNPPKFSNLRHMDVIMCFHEHNFGAFATLLCHSPALESLNLLHKVPKFSYRARERSRKDWASKLPRIVIDNCGYACFRNLHLGQHSKELQLIKLLGKRCISWKQAHH